MTLIESILLGIVEGFTEFLPISSTAHLVLTANLLGLSQSDFVKTFEIAIQSGAILAVLLLYFRKFFDIEVLKRVIVAFIPTGIIGFLLYKTVKTYLIGSTGIMLWSLALGGLFLILFEYFFKRDGNIKNIQEISYKNSFFIGLFQAVAIVPGVSRAAATIIGGLLLGVERRTIVEFSFLLAVPTLLAATGLDLLKSYGEFSNSQFSTLALGFVASFVTAIVSIKFLLGFVRTHTFTAFGVYRVLLVLAVLSFMIF